MTPPIDRASPSSRSDAILWLAQTILSRVDAPKDHFEVAAHLEVAGIRDVDARQEYGCADVFELAREIMAFAAEVDSRPSARRKRPAPLLWRFLKGYASGLFFLSHSSRSCRRSWIRKPRWPQAHR